MFLLKKEWYDPAPGIEMVEIHFASTPAGEPPDWNRRGETRVLQPVPGTLPKYRVCGIEIPRWLNGSDRYDLHYFFLVVQNAREQWLPPVTEQIVGREITYVDNQGDCTLVGARWAVRDMAFGNYTLLHLDGLEMDFPEYSSPYLRGGEESTGLEFPRIYEFVKSRPLPHVFRGMVHGPVGSEILFNFNLLNLGGSDATQESEQWDNNNNRNWAVTLV